MLRVGLTGGLASGKTHVGRELVALGCHLLQADQIGHQLLQPEGAAYARVVEAFGPSILTPDNKIDRKKLGSIVFAQPAELKRLNEIVHPLVFQEQERWFADVAAGDPAAIAVVEAAIMVEIGSYQRYDKLILAYCTEEQQIARAMARDGLSEAAVRDRLARQMPLAEKKRHADYLIDTSGTREQTNAQVRQVYQALARQASAQGAQEGAK